MFEASSPMIYGNIIEGNKAWFGSGVYFKNSSPNMWGNIIKENDAKLEGGAIYCRDCPTGKSWIYNNMLSGNTSDDLGGAIYVENVSDLVLENNVFNGNSTDYAGGGIFSRSAPLSIMNNTFSGNSSDIYGGVIFLDWDSCHTTITNTILWNHDALYGPAVLINGSTLTITYSDIEGGQSSILNYGKLNWGPGMIDSDPLFVDEADNDFHLTFSSRCKDTGDTSAVTEPYDFEGDPRIAYGAVDMGADEFYTHLYITGDTTPGGNIEGKFVGLPGTRPVGLWLGSGELDPPLPSMFGDWYLEYPWIGPFVLGSIPSPDGVLVIPATLPAAPPAPYDLYMQALIGDELTNLCILKIE
jgi:hypothetical protein